MSMEPAQESAASSDSSATDAGTPPTNAQLLRMLVLLKLKLVAGYILDGFAPVVAVIALIVAVMAINGNKSSHAELAQNSARIASMGESLLAAKAEIEKLKALIAQEKLIREEERKKLDEQMTKIIQGVTKLQTKMKVSPTLDEQLHQPVAALIAPSPLATAAPASAAVKAVIAPAKAGTISATASVSTGADKKTGSQTQILKEAIGQFNKSKK